MPDPTNVPLRDETLRLEDGRTLAYATWGEPGGAPVLFFHTSPGSRLLCPDGPATARAGVRLITVDRPGYGRSTPDLEPRMLGWARDVRTLADHLALDRFSMVGWSGGGMFALACAAQLPERVGTAALVVSPAPDEDVPWLADPIREMVAQIRSDPDGAVGLATAANEWYRAAPEAPIEIWSAPGKDAIRHRPGVSEAMSVMLREGARQGASGPAYDQVAGSLELGFAPADVAGHVELWYAAQDPVVPPAHGHFYANQLPDASDVHVRDGDHLLPLGCWAEILASL